MLTVLGVSHLPIRGEAGTVFNLLTNPPPKKQSEGNIQIELLFS